MRTSTRLTAALSVGALLLSACGTEEDPGGNADDRPPPQTLPVTEPTASGPVPAGKGGEGRDDLNGDGRPDLVFTTAYTEDPDPTAPAPQSLVVVYGAEQGPNPATRTVVSAEGRRTYAASGDGNGLHPATADLDGDGYSDIPVHEEAAEGDHDMNGVIWGRPGGPDPGAALTPVEPPAGADPGSGADPDHSAPTPGDFDGDGHADLAYADGDITSLEMDLTVLYGPFGRDGTCARSGSRLLKGRAGGLLADEIEDGRATALMVRPFSDGEQTASRIYPGGPDGPGAHGSVELVTGTLGAFGDFNGDGERDVAVGDNGSRNNEPGYETEKPGVDGKLSVYYGTPQGLDAKPRTYSLPGAVDPGDSAVRDIAVADLDGDGADELATGTNVRGVDVFRSADGGDLAPRRQRPLKRTGPATGPEGKVPATSRVARVFAAGDYDGDGAQERVLAYDPGVLRVSPVQWWVTDGWNDEGAFSSAKFTE